MDDHVSDASSTPSHGCLVLLVLLGGLVALAACAPDSPLQVRSPPVASNLDSGLVGSSQGKTYHRSACEWARKVSRRNLVKFSNEDEATKKGYGPCRTCIAK